MSRSSSTSSRPRLAGRVLAALASLVLIVTTLGPAMAADFRSTYEGPGGQGWIDFSIHVEIRAVAPTADGGAVVVGSTSIDHSNIDPRSMLVMRLRSDGTILWQRAFGADVQENGYAVVVSPEGDIVVAGSNADYHQRMSGPWMEHPWVLQLTPQGEVEWEYIYGHEGDIIKGAASIIRNREGGGYLLAGSNSERGGDSAWMLALDWDGSVDWQYRYDVPIDLRGPVNPQFQDLVPTMDGGCIAVGSMFGDAWVVRIGGGGHLLWERSLGGPDADAANAVDLIGEGDIVLAGYTKRYSPTLKDYQPDAWVARMTDLGHVTWQYAYGTRDDEEALDLVVIGQEIAVTGYWGSQREDFDAMYNPKENWVFLLEHNGNMARQFTVEGPDGVGYSDAEAIAEDGGGHLLVAGDLTLPKPHDSARAEGFVTRLDPAGEIGCAWDTSFEPVPTHYVPYILGATDWPINTWPVSTGELGRPGQIQHHEWCQ